ncbi:hypothetical protein F4703DRAFT_1945538 [Phycomyces blakesleeanus]
MNNGFIELEIVMEKPRDYYGSGSTDEETKYENNPRLTDSQVDAILLQERTKENEVETSETDNNTLNCTARIFDFRKNHQEDHVYNGDALGGCETTRKRLDFPKPDAVINFYLRAKNEDPVFKTSPVEDTNRKSKVHEFSINKPSEYIKHILAIPGKTSQLSALPDFTENQRLNPNQGNKWKEDPLIQHSMLTFEESDYWVGNVVEVQGCSNRFLLEKFFTENGSSYANAFQVYGGHGPFLNHPDDAYFWSCGKSTNFAVFVPKYKMEVNKFLSIVQKDSGSGSFFGFGFPVSSCYTEIIDRALVGVKFRLWSNTSNIEDFKRIIAGTSDLMKVVICQLNMYSDDTSGNDSKQYNAYDSYLLYFAAMALEERNKRENTLFVCTSNHILNAVEMLPPVADDLVVSEKGIEMYSEDLGEYVSLVTPLLLFMGDNPSQSQPAMHKGTSSKCLCRRCIFPSPRLVRKHITGALRFFPVDHFSWPHRSKNFLSAFASSDNQSDVYKCSHSFGYIKNGSEEFFRLKAFDQTKDMPFEILHMIPLGFIECLFIFLWKQPVLTAVQKDSLQREMASYRSCKSYNRTFRNQLCHSGSFVGRDFKQLIQILSAFHAVARLSSLVYMRAIHVGFDYYLMQIRSAVDEVTKVLRALDLFILTTKDKLKQQDFSFKPKLHLLHQNGEQFNKFICEHLFKTNRQATSRDVTKKFTKQFMCRHLCNGGSYIVEKRVGNGTRPVRYVPSEFIKCAPIDFPAFNLHFFGSRANSDNSGSSIPNLRDTLAGVFQANGRWLLGQVSIEALRDERNRLVRKTFMMQEYQMIPSVNANTVYSRNVVTDPYGNIEAVDIHVTRVPDSSRRLLNVPKFGMFWWMLTAHVTVYPIPVNHNHDTTKDNLYQLHPRAPNTSPPPHTFRPLVEFSFLTDQDNNYTTFSFENDGRCDSLFLTR